MSYTGAVSYWTMPRMKRWMGYKVGYMSDEVALPLAAEREYFTFAFSISTRRWRCSAKAERSRNRSDTRCDTTGTLLPCSTGARSSLMMRFCSCSRRANAMSMSTSAASRVHGSIRAVQCKKCGLRIDAGGTSVRCGGTWLPMTLPRKSNHTVPIALAISVWWCTRGGWTSTAPCMCTASFGLAPLPTTVTCHPARCRK